MKLDGCTVATIGNDFKAIAHPSWHLIYNILFLLVWRNILIMNIWCVRLIKEMLFKHVWDSMMSKPFWPKKHFRSFRFPAVFWIHNLCLALNTFRLKCIGQLVLCVFRFSIMIQFQINVIRVLKLNVYCAVHHLECQPIYYVAVNAWLFANWYKWNDLLMQYARNHKYTNVHLLSASVCMCGFVEWSIIKINDWICSWHTQVPISHVVVAALSTLLFHCEFRRNTHQYPNQPCQCIQSTGICMRNIVGVDIIK